MSPVLKFYFVKEKRTAR